MTEIRHHIGLKYGVPIQVNPYSTAMIKLLHCSCWRSGGFVVVVVVSFADRREFVPWEPGVLLGPEDHPTVIQGTHKISSFPSYLNAQVRAHLLSSNSTLSSFWLNSKMPILHSFGVALVSIKRHLQIFIPSWKSRSYPDAILLVYYHLQRVSYLVIGQKECSFLLNTGISCMLNLGFWVLYQICQQTSLKSY